MLTRHPAATLPIPSLCGSDRANLHAVRDLREFVEGEFNRMTRPESMYPVNPRPTLGKQRARRADALKARVSKLKDLEAIFQDRLGETKKES